jgi:hypothetical protein
VGNAFPPPVAHAVAQQLVACLTSRGRTASMAG